MSIFKLSWIFLKLSNISDVLLSRNPDKREFIEYLLSTDNSNDVIYWALEQVRKGSTEEEVEEAIEFYNDNKDAFLEEITKYSVKFILAEKVDIESLDKLDIDLGAHIKDKKTKDELEDYFVNNDIRLISGSGGGYLGAGFFGKVFEVLYKNKRCALKVTSDRDANGYMNVINLIKGMPEEVAKNFPIIYRIDRVNNQTYCVIMELLQQLPKGMALEGWGKGGVVSGVEIYKYSAKYFEQLKEKMPEIFSTIINKEIDLIDKHIFLMAFKEVDYNSIINEVHRSISSANASFFNHEAIGYFLEKAVAEVFREAFKITKVYSLSLPKLKQQELLSAAFPDGFDYTIKNIESEFLDSYSHEIYSKTGFYRDTFKKDRLKGDDKAGKEIDNQLLNDLQRSLDWCFENMGLSYRDVKSDNVMYRPATKSLVVVDLGLFKVSEQ